MNVYAKFHCAPLRIKKALGIFRELIPRRTTTTIAFWDPPFFWVQNEKRHCVQICALATCAVREGRNILRGCLHTWLKTSDGMEVMCCHKHPHNVLLMHDWSVSMSLAIITLS